MGKEKMNREIKKVYEDTYNCFRDKYKEDNKAWNRFIDFLAVDHFPPLMHQLDHKFEDIANDAKFITKLKSVYKPQVLKQDYHDYLGEMYMETQGKSQIDRKGQFLTPESASGMLAKMTIGNDAKQKPNILDPCVGTGRLLISAYKVRPESNLFGVDIDINALRIAYTNFRIHGIRDFYLLHADSLLHETDVSKPEGSYNWQFANQWYSHMNELKEIDHYENKKQLELQLN